MGDPAGEHIFQFDTPFEPVVFGGDVALHGWLLHREGKPVHGIRAIVKRRFRKRQEFRARRKRNRPDVASAFPEIPEAMTSGFFLEFPLGFGRNQITLEVLDHDRLWRAFHSASALAFPFSFATRLGLLNLRLFLLFYLKHVVTRLAPHLVLASAVPPVPADSKQSQVHVTVPAALRTRHINLFATSKSNLFILEIGELVAAGFREIGCTAELHLDQIPKEKPPDDTLQIIVTPHEYYNLFLSELLGRHAARRLTRNAILLCTEQPETHWFVGNLRWAIHARSVADINPLGVLAYRHRGLNCHLLPLGYHPILAHPGNSPHPHRVRNIDIAFLGSLTPRRDQFFAENAGFFSQHRCHLRLVPLGFAKTKLTKSYLSIERRNELLNQTKILLNIHYSEQKYFEWHRMLVGLANGCCIITETCQGYGALEPGKHFIMVEPEYLIPCCEYYLAHPEECEKIARQGLEFVQTELRQGQACGLYLQQIAADAALELGHSNRNNNVMPAVWADDSPSYPLPPELTRRLSQHTGRLLGRAAMDDFRHVWERLRISLGRSREEPEAKSLSEAEVRRDVVLKRTKYHARWLEQERAQVNGVAFFEMHENEAFARCREPKLSVVITLYNYARFIEECVTSVSAASRKFAEDLEVIIVNDASTDHSLAQALRCAKKFDLPIRIVDKKWNTGLADARNVGVRLARGPYVFILDADNLVYPDAFTQLFEVISQGNYSAAFSLLCRFEETPANPVGLLSYFDWDPQILVQYPYIDAMAMFRRESLLAEPGYDNELNQIGWFGWEDYEMWLRFAQNHHEVAFVPNILCLYRHHETSMINTTNLFEIELVHHLMGKYGELVERFEPRERLFGVERSKIFQTKEDLATGAFHDGDAG
jgi:glycosyltransferase involved in cell wall biosynthesis